LPPGQPYYEIYPASGPVAFSAKRNPTCINQGTAEHNAREYSRDGRAYVIEHVGTDGKRTKVGRVPQRSAGRHCRHRGWPDVLRVAAGIEAPAGEQGGGRGFFIVS
jgi:hypothetical protein